MTDFPTILSPIKAKTVTVSNTTLFHVAAERLGDATQWNRILALNPGLKNADGFWDYEISGIVTLNLPPVDANASNGGILDIFPAA